MTEPKELTAKRGADIATYALIKVACHEAELILEVISGEMFQRQRADRLEKKLADIPSELRQRLFADANELEAIARRVREHVLPNAIPGRSVQEYAHVVDALSVTPPEYPWTGTLNDKARWTAVYESGVAEGRRLGRDDVLSALRSGPPSGWCTYQIREGLAEEVANTIGLADGIVKEIELECSGCKDAKGQWVGPCEDGRMHRSWCSTGIREVRRQNGSPIDDLVCAPMVPKGST